MLGVKMTNSRTSSVCRGGRRPAIHVFADRSSIQTWMPTFVGITGWGRPAGKSSLVLLPWRIRIRCIRTVAIHMVKANTSSASLQTRSTTSRKILAPYRAPSGHQLPVQISSLINCKSLCVTIKSGCGDTRVYLAFDPQLDRDCLTNRHPIDGGHNYQAARFTAAAIARRRL